MTSHLPLSHTWIVLCVCVYVCVCSCLCVCVCVCSREVQECVPPQFYSKQGSQQWLNMVMQHLQQVQALNPHQARAQFLGKISACSDENMLLCYYVII